MSTRDTRDYLDSVSRRTADVLTATIEARNDDGTYMLRTIGSQALIRASKANPVDEFALSSRVLVSRPDASRNVLGALPVIQSRAPREQRGLSGSTPDESETSFGATVIISVDPDPLVLIVGGEPGVQTIFGVNLGEAATYAGDDGLTSPSLTNDEAPVVGASIVTMTISADEDSLLGEWNLSINGARAKNALSVIKRPGPLRSIWALTYNASFEPHLLRVDPSTMEVFRDYSIADPYHVDMIRAGARIAVKAGFTMAVFDRISGDPLALIAVEQSFTPCIAERGGILYYNALAGGLGSFDLEAATETMIPWDFADRGVVLGIAFDDAACWITSSLPAGTKLFQLDPETFAEIASVPYAECVEIALTALHVFIMRDSGTSTRELVKVSKADLSEIASVEVMAANVSYTAGTTQIVAFGDFVYGTVRTPDNTSAFFFRVTIADMSLATIAIPEGPTGLTVVTGFAFVGDVAGGITAIDLETMTVIRRDQYDMAEVNRLVYA